MEVFTVKAMGESVDIKYGETYETLAERFSSKLKNRPMAAIRDGVIKELGRAIGEEGGEIAFLDITDEDGMRIYHRTLSIVMLLAVKNLLGEKADVVIENSINKCLYCYVRNNGFKHSQEFLDRLSQEMNSIIARDARINKNSYRLEEAQKIVRKFGMDDKAKLFEYRNSSYVNLYEIEGFCDYFYGYMAPSSGYVNLFKLELYADGFIIIMPDEKNPDRLWEFKDYKKISGVFIEQMEWGRLMGVENVAQLNDLIVRGEFGDLVRINEALHEKKTAYIADMIAKNRDKIKMVLIAGPSSSGKTTFCQRLCVQLRVNGITPHPISLDNYFIERDRTPLDEFGKRDFENINALDTEQFNTDMLRLIAGERIELPTYNFVSGKREYKGDFKQLNEGEIFVIEGIHGLNDELTMHIPKENKFKIFISAMTQLNIDAHNRISTTDSRLIRRIVRDNQFRGTKASETIARWNSVTRGEQRNIFPFQESADVIFNSATIYELSVLKPYIEPLLHNIEKNSDEYRTANRILKFIGYFIGVNSDIVPNNAIMKEFLGGSCFNV